jgi:hypothetical protein
MHVHHIISMYARGISVREIQGHILELYGLQVSCDDVGLRHGSSLPLVSCLVTPSVAKWYMQTEKALRRVGRRSALP